MAYDLTDFEPETASPVAVKSPVSKSRQDLSDFEPVDPSVSLTDAQKQGLKQLDSATFGPASMIGYAQRMNRIEDVMAENERKDKAQAAVTEGAFDQFNTKLATSPLAKMPEVNLPEQPAVPDVTRPIQPVKQVTTEDVLPVAKEVPSHGVYANETPTLISNIREGKFEDAAALAKESVMGSKPMRFLFGPTEQQQIAESVPVKKEDGTTDYQFKPASTDAVEKLGAVGAARRSIASLERGIPVTELDKQVDSEMMKDDPKDSTLKAIGKGLFNAVHRTTVALSDPTMALIPESRLISAGFTLDMANSAKEQIQKGLEAENPREAVEGLLGGVITLGMAGMAGKHTLKEGEKPTKADIIEHMDKVPDELLHEASKELKTSSPDVADAANSELLKRAAETGKELSGVLQRLPGDVQDKVNGILQKQLNGEELTPNERATLLQVRSYASRLQQEQSNADFTASTETPAVSKPATATPTGSTAEVPSGGTRIQPTPIADASQQGGRSALFAKAEAEAATQPLREAAASAEETAPAAAQAAKEQADLLEKRAQEQARLAAEKTSPPPAVEPPAQGQQEPPIAAVERPQAEEVAPVTEGAAAKPEPGTRIVGPILQHEGKTYAEGKVGQHHKDIVGEALDNYFKENPGADEAPRFDHLFKDDKGNVHDRESGWDVAEKAGQIPEGVASAARTLAGEEKPQLHADHLKTDDLPTPTSKTEPPSVERPVAASPESVERPPSEAPAAPEAPVEKSGLTDAAIKGDAAEMDKTESVGSVYEGTFRGEKKWFVQESDKRGFGDSIHNTPEEAAKSAALTIRQKADRAASLAKFEAEKNAREVAKREREDLDGFDAEMPPMKRGNIVKQLTTRLNYRGAEMTRRDLIRKMVNEGRRVETEGKERRLINDRDEFLGEKVLTKAGMDYAQWLIDQKNEPPEPPHTEPTPPAEPVSPESKTSESPIPEDRTTAGDSATAETPVEKSGTLLDKLESLLTEEEPPATAEAPQSAAQKRVNDIQRDIENNANAEPAWKRRRQKDLKAAKEALAKEGEAAPAPVESAAEPAPAEKQIWQKTRDEVKNEGESLTKHRAQTRAAVERGENVPLEVLEGYSGYHWADKMRREKYGEQVSDSFLTKIIDSLKDENGNLHFDPLFIQSVGKPALRGAVKLIREAAEAGGLAKDVMTDVIQYIRDHTDTFDEAKAREFFQPVIDEALGQKEAPTEEATGGKETPGSPTSEPTPAEQPAPVQPTTNPRMVDEGGRKLTSTKNEIVDQERQRRGEAPIFSEAKKALGATWDEAMDEFAKNPKAGEDLVAELNKKPRAVTAKEEAVMLREKVDVMNELTKATETALNESADPADRVEARVRSAVLMDQLNEIDEATRKAGTEWGRTGRFRQMLAAEDYSLSRMIQKKQLAMGEKWSEMSPEEKAKVTEQTQKMSERIASLEKQLAEHEASHAQELERVRNEEADKAIQQMASKPETPADAYTRGVLEKIQSGLKSQADKARARIRARLGKASAGVDPTVLYDVAVIGAEKLFSTGLDFARWSSEMLSDVGDSLKHYLTEETFKQSQEINDKAIEKGAPKSVREKIKPKAPQTDSEKQQNLVNRIADKRKSGAREAIGGSIQKLAESFVRQGITEREPLIDAVHAAVKEALPEASRKDIRDAISGYGEYKELSKDEGKVILRDLKGQMQQVSKLEDMLKSGKLPARTGVERREPSAEERQLIKEVNKIKKELGLESTNPDQLKSALDAAKTRTRNRIEDLQRAIEKKEKIPKSEKALKEDDELRDLRVQQEALQKEYEATFGEPKPSAEQIAAQKAQQAVDRAAAVLDRQQRINKGEIQPESKEKAQPLSQLEKELKDRTEELREAKRKADAYRSPEEVAAEKAQKGVDRAAAALDRQKRINSGEIQPEPKEKVQPLSELEKELRDQTAQLREAKRKADAYKSPETIAAEKAQKGVDAAAAALDRWDRIAKGELTPDPKAAKEPGSNLEEELKAQTEAIKQAVREVNRKPTDEQAKMIRTLEKATEEYRRRATAGETKGEGKEANRPDTELVAKAREARDAAKKILDDLRKAQNPPRTPDEIALAAYKARTKARIDELNDRTKRGDFSKKERKSVTLDPEGVRLRAEAERAKLEFDKALYRDKQKNMPMSQRILDYIPKIARANLLSNPITLAKLTAAALLRMGATPVEEAIGGGLGKLPFISEVASRAPREGGFNVKAEAKALTDAWMKGMKDAKDKLFKGETDLDVTSGKRNVIPHHWLDIFGSMHGALKAPVVRAEFARSFEKRTANAAANGIDITDPAVQVRIGLEAFRDSQRAIFQQDNRVVQIWNTAMRQLEQPSKVTGRVSLGNKALQTVAKTIFPIVKIPTNIVAEAFQYATGTVTGSARLAKAFKSGIETLKPEEADLIMRELKKGTLGSAVMLLGFFASQAVGGFYQPGQRRKEGDVKPGTVRVFDHDIPSFLLHNPAMEQLQVGATIGRVMNSKLRHKDRETQGLPAGIAAAALGLIEEVPFATGTEQMHKLFTPNERMDYVGELTRSRVEPQFIQWMAQQGDRASYLPPSEVRQRKPEDFTQEMEMGIPGLRQNVPLKRKRSWR